MRRSTIAVRFAMFLCALSVLAGPALAAPAAPLRLEGKNHVYRRLITHPEAKLYDSPGDRAGRELQTFTAMYIYDDGHKDRLLVGRGRNGAEGWVDRAHVTEWPHAVTMLFTPRTGRAPVMFFRTRAGLEQAIDRALKNPATAVGLRKDFEALLAGKATGKSPVVAMEPGGTAVAQKNFYLMPVLAFEAGAYGSRTKLLEVAAIDPGLDRSPEQTAVRTARAENRDLRFGFVFVIDTTISMRPYIDRTRDLVRELYNTLETHPYKDRLAFAVAAFRRGSMGKGPDAEYVTKIISDFAPVGDRRRLEDALAKVREAPKSTNDIREDSFAGIKAAVDGLSWGPYQGRAMLLVTDAGPLGKDEPDASTRLGPADLADILKQRRIHLTAVHIKDVELAAKRAQVAEDHRYAEKAYRELTSVKGQDLPNNYIEIRAGRNREADKTAFAEVAWAQGEAWARVVRNRAEEKPVEQPAPVPDNFAALSPKEQSEIIAKRIGHAVELQFLGDREGSRAPRMVRAWATDGILEEESGYALEPAVLLARDQINHLGELIRAAIAAGQESIYSGEGGDTHRIMRSVVTRLTTTPEELERQDGRRLMESALLDELQSILPYKSKFGGMTVKAWKALSITERDEYVRDLEGKIERYKDLTRSTGGWMLNNPKEEFRDAKDWLYRLPLDMLP